MRTIAMLSALGTSFICVIVLSIIGASDLLTGYVSGSVNQFTYWTIIIYRDYKKSHP